MPGPWHHAGRAVIASGIIQASAGIGDALMSPALQTLIEGYGVQVGMGVFAIPFVAMIPIVIWLGHLNKAVPTTAEEEEAAIPTLSPSRARP